MISKKLPNHKIYILSPKDDVFLLFNVFNNFDILILINSFNVLMFSCNYKNIVNGNM